MLLLPLDTGGGGFRKMTETTTCGSMGLWKVTVTRSGRSADSWAPRRSRLGRGRSYLTHTQSRPCH